MKDMDKLVKSTVSLLALTTTTVIINTASANTTSTSPKLEKCYGIVKAGMNDCETNVSSCAGSATKDKQPDAYLMLPKGTCQKIVGGSLTKS